MSRYTCRFYKHDFYGSFATYRNQKDLVLEIEEADEPKDEL